MKRRVVLHAVVLAIASLGWGEIARAFEILVDYNTFKVRDGIEQTTALKCGGVWCILQNSDLNDAQWQTVFEHTGSGVAVAEDNPGPNNHGQAPANNFDRLQHLLGKVDGTLCYNETGSAPGGTLLSNAQIDQDAANHSGKVIVLTRAYSTNPNDPWRKETDRCLSNPKVYGVAMETVDDYGKYACDVLLNNALRLHHKPVYFLLPSGKAAYTTQSIKLLQTRQPALMRDRQAFIVLCPYQTPGSPWFGPAEGSLESVLKVVRGMDH